MTALFFCFTAALLFFGWQWHGRCAAAISQKKEFSGQLMKESNRQVSLLPHSQNRERKGI